MDVFYTCIDMSAQKFRRKYEAFFFKLKSFASIFVGADQPRRAACYSSFSMQGASGPEGPVIFCNRNFFKSSIRLTIILPWSNWGPEGSSLC